MRYDFMRINANHITGPVNVSIDGRLVARFETTLGSPFAAFVEGIARSGASLYDADRAQYIVGNLDQLMGVAP